jgi:hypothetical protein
MSFLYCRNCGHKNIYTLTPPNFCNSCGESFSDNSTKAKKVREIPSEPLNDDETDIDQVPIIARLEVDISHDKSKVFKGSELLRIEEPEVNKQKPKSVKKKTKSKVRRQVKRN